jgi:hypothetical protein
MTDTSHNRLGETECIRRIILKCLSWTCFGRLHIQEWPRVGVFGKGRKFGPGSPWRDTARDTELRARHKTTMSAEKLSQLADLPKAKAVADQVIVPAARMFGPVLPADA